MKGVSMGHTYKRRTLNGDKISFIQWGGIKAGLKWIQLIANKPRNTTLNQELQKSSGSVGGKGFVF